MNLLANYANYDQCALDWIEAADDEEPGGWLYEAHLQKAAVFAQLAVAAATAALAQGGARSSKEPAVADRLLDELRQGVL